MSRLDSASQEPLVLKGLKETGSKFEIHITKQKTNIYWYPGEVTIQVCRSQFSNSNISHIILPLLVKADKSYYACVQFIKSKALSRATKSRIYKTIIRPVATYACETWTTTTNTRQKLQSFESKILRRIVGTVYDEESVGEDAPTAGFAIW